jgi:fimbrial chaperone protein
VLRTCHPFALQALSRRDDKGRGKLGNTELKEMLLKSALVTSCLLGLLAIPPPAAGAQFTVNPTRIVLTPRATSALLTLHNDGASTIRLEVKTHAWSQSLTGQMELAPTDDVVVFPTQISLAPGEDRKLRIAVTTPPGDVEKSYRVFLEELPPAAGAAPAGAAVQMLTRVGIPVFLQPGAPAAPAVGVEGVELEKDVLHFRIENRGAIHLIPDAIRVIGLSASGQVVVDKSTDGWYILARTARQYDLRFGSAECASVRSVLVEVRAGGKTISRAIAAPEGACAR